MSIKGLRVAVTLASLGTCLGAWIKVFSVAPDKFWILVIGQSTVATFEVFLLGTSAHLAAEWFGSNEVSSACSIGSAGCQIGIALSFILVPIIVRSDNSLSDIESELFYMAVGVAVLCSINLVLVLLAFRRKPPLPPSQARLLKNLEHIPNSIFKALKGLVTDKSFMFLAVVYGIDVGISYALSILLNQIILSRYTNAFKDAGIIGLLFTSSGILGSILFGVVLDKYKLYKTTMVTVQICFVGGMILFTYCLMNNIIAVYISTTLLGLFSTGIIPIGFEVATEITYPEAEGTTSGLLNVSAQLSGIGLIYLYSYLFYNMGLIYANSFLTILVFIGFLLLLSTPFNLKRQQANSKKLTI